MCAQKGRAAVFENVKELTGSGCCRVLVPVFPFALTQRIGIDSKDTQHWVSVLLAVYGAALFVAAPITGWLADRSPSRRTPFLIGILILAGATVMLCVGRSISVLVVGRILQGASASVVWVVGLAVIADTVGPAEGKLGVGLVLS